ncbi:MAG: lipopolysaccharide biosynthesis protein [Cetobacterium sp.]
MNLNNLMYKIKNSQLGFNIIFSIIFKGIGIVLGLIVVPLMLKLLGQEMYGLWILILSIINWIYTFDIGIGNGIKNKIAEKLALKEDKEISEIISCGYMGLLLISSLFFAILLIGINFLDIQSILNTKILTENLLKKIITINVFFVCLNFLFSLCNNIFYGFQKAYLTSLNNVLSQALSLIFILLLLYYGKNSIILLSITYGLSILLSHLILTIYFFMNEKNIKFSLKIISLKKIKNLLSLGGKIFIVQICGLIIFSTDNFIITYFLGMDKVTEYNITNKLFMVPMIIMSLILGPIWPAITKAYHEKDKVWIKNLLKKMQKMWLIISCSVVILILIGKELVYYWTLKTINPNFLLVSICGLSTILTSYSGIYSTPLFAMGINIKIVVLSIGQAILNIILSYIFIKYLDVSGVILATCFCMATNIYFLPKWLNEKIEKINKEI